MHLKHLKSFNSLNNITLRLFVLIALLFSFTLLPSPVCIAQTNRPNSFNQTKNHYLAAKKYFLQLENTPLLKQNRSNWLKGIRNFRRIYLANQTSQIAPSCLFMMARIYHRMYEQFKRPLDLDETLDNYTKLASLYPRSRLADDALFALAQINTKILGTPDKAAQYYKKIIKEYPDGDQHEMAHSILKDLIAANRIQLDENELKTNPEEVTSLVSIYPVKYWSSQDYTRIVIRTSGPVKYYSRLLEKYNNQPRQLFIDFKQSELPKLYNSPIPIQDGLLKQIRIAPFANDAVRVVLDIESIADYKMYSLKDPFRLIIDVRGTLPNNTNIFQSVPDESSPVQPPEMRKKKTGKTVRNVYITLQDHKKTRPRSHLLKNRKQDGPAEPLSLAQQLGLGVRRIVIDPGHGGKDPGATAFSLKEKNVTLKVAKKTAEILRNKYGLEVILTRTDDTYLSLEERTALANTHNADLFVSVHVNANPQKTAKGVETFFLNLATNNEAMLVAARENATSTHNISEMQGILSDLMKNAKIKESSQLAEFVQLNLYNGLKRKKYVTRNLGVKQAPFYVLIGADMPAILAEISFITNPAEAKLLKQEQYLQCIGRQLAKGVSEYVKHRRSATLALSEE